MKIVGANLLVCIVLLWAASGAAEKKNDDISDSTDIHKIFRCNILDTIDNIIPDAAKTFIEKNTKYLRLPVKVLTLGTIELRP